MVGFNISSAGWLDRLYGFMGDWAQKRGKKTLLRTEVSDHSYNENAINCCYDAGGRENAYSSYFCKVIRSLETNAQKTTAVRNERKGKESVLWNRLM